MEAAVTVYIDITLVVVEPRARHYDLNGNGRIGKSEALRAISDYFARLIDKETTQGILALYYAH